MNIILTPNEDYSDPSDDSQNCTFPEQEQITRNPTESETPNVHDTSHLLLHSSFAQMFSVSFIHSTPEKWHVGVPDLLVFFGQLGQQEDLKVCYQDQRSIMQDSPMRTDGAQ